MRTFELVKISKGILKLLSNLDVKIDDYKYVDLFDEYETMAKNGDKISYIVTFLSQKYNISEASVYRLIKRFKNTINS